MKTRFLSALVMGAVCLSTSVFVSAKAAEVNVYSFRQEFLMQPIVKAFEKESGIKVNIVFAKKGLLNRLEAEGANSPADLLLTSNFSKLQQAKDKGLTQAIESAQLNANIPAQFRDNENHWYGLTQRVRAIYASKDRVKEGEITSYEDLAQEEWYGRICTRSGKHSYNLALIASMIAHHGEADAETWLAGVKYNLARKPTGNDRGQVKGIFSGECDLSLGNSYYLGKMMTNEDQIAWADSVRIIFPNQEDRGAHVNISGVAMTASAKNTNEAQAFMEFLSSGMAQKIYAEVNYEYPVKVGVSPSELVASWGEFKADELNLSEVAASIKAASDMVDRVTYDF
jgi:iron(III) transport system substrate-binding protein